MNQEQISLILLGIVGVVALVGFILSVIDESAVVQLGTRGRRFREDAGVVYNTFVDEPATVGGRSRRYMEDAAVVRDPIFEDDPAFAEVGTRSRRYLPDAG